MKYITLLALCCCLQATAQTSKNLRCDYLTNPIGIDNPHPRLSWQYNSTTANAHIQVYQNNQLRWDTTTPNNYISYSGPALQPFTTYQWKINGTTASFETGMMQPHNWQGTWISDHHPISHKPAPLFRKTFNNNKTIAAARAYIAAGGLYELHINGKKIGHHLLDPMYTRFDRRTLYVTYDVTNNLQNGNNTIGVILGNGWYNHQSTAVWNFDKAPWRNRPTFCLDLRITFTDGTTTTISTGKDWKTATGEIVFNSIYTGEHHDLRQQQASWDLPAFNDSAWQPVTLRAAPSNNIVAQAMVPITADTVLQPATIHRFSDTNYIFDLGRNIAGVSSITLNGPAGTVVQLKHAEQLYPNGHADISNIDVHYRPTDNTDPFQTDIYILDGKGPHTFTPAFNYKGFQFIEVTSSQPITLTKESLQGIVMHSNVKPIGNFQSSNTLLNKIWAATNNSYLANLYGYPTDCPQREKNGWTGDAHIASETGLYNFDAITVYEKWMNDHLDEQQPNGVFPSIIPTGGWGYEWGNGPDWTSTIAIIPWNLYLFYGDTTALSHCYPAIKRYVDQLTARSPDGLCAWGLGDWVPVKSVTPVTFTSTAYYFTDVTILAKTAKLLGYEDDHRHYTQLADVIKTAFNKKYLDPRSGIYDKGLQTEQSVALHWNLVPDTLRSKAAAALAARVKADSLKLDVGLLGTKTILNALSDNGYIDLAYQLAASEKEPSWGWWIKNGATTLYENWPINAKSDLSRNHIMFGEIGAWLYKALAGIKPDEKSPGFKSIIISPKFPAGLNNVQCTHTSMYGDITVAWERKGKDVLLTVELPANTTARVILSKEVQLNKAGKHLIRINKENVQLL
ncbi:alpha-L-rhamnosidase [Chitinophaga sp. sic0106]|uniref:alpha-L-rhamnosidase n=1 Tax=Chitinophaga sp. sic0106 TaxID=2854785 RepID=UPI001C464681|nr:alpha-L-rhamnosidase [Chitinophaga sp. sic0106]MBV7533162.1 glycoside hydrolase family 78 protein [Chitinophaga sp. sic0106]